MKNEIPQLATEVPTGAPGGLLVVLVVAEMEIVFDVRQLELAHLYQHRPAGLVHVADEEDGKAVEEGLLGAGAHEDHADGVDTHEVPNCQLQQGRDNCQWRYDERPEKPQRRAIRCGRILAPTSLDFKPRGGV